MRYSGKSNNWGLAVGGPAHGDLIVFSGMIYRIPRVRDLENFTKVSDNVGAMISIDYHEYKYTVDNAGECMWVYIVTDPDEAEDMADTA